MTETIVKAQESVQWEIETMEVKSVTRIKPGPFQQKRLLSLLNYVWYYTGVLSVYMQIFGYSPLTIHVYNIIY